MPRLLRSRSDAHDRFLAHACHRSLRGFCSWGAARGGRNGDLKSGPAGNEREGRDGHRHPCCDSGVAECLTDTGGGAAFDLFAAGRSGDDHTRVLYAHGFCRQRRDADGASGNTCVTSGIDDAGRDHCDVRSWRDAASDRDYNHARCFDAGTRGNGDARSAGHRSIDGNAARTGRDHDRASRRFVGCDSDTHVASRRCRYGKASRASRDHAAGRYAGCN